MEGIAAAAARVGEISALLTDLRQRGAPPASTSFADVLRTAAVTRAAPTASAASTAPAAAPASWPAGAFRPESLRATGTGHVHKGAPAELAAYGNGRVPETALTPIGGGHRLWQPAAAAWERLHDAAAAAGVRLGVNDSYRSYEQQVDVAARKGLYSQGGLAAAPGTSSHGWGRSLDLDLDGRAQSWMRANAARFGFVEDVPREPWHWTYTG